MFVAMARGNGRIGTQVNNTVQYTNAADTSIANEPFRAKEALLWIAINHVERKECHSYSFVDSNTDRFVWVSYAIINLVSRISIVSRTINTGYSINTNGVLFY